MLLSPTFLSSSSQPASSFAGANAALMLLGPSTAISELWTQVRRLAPHVRFMSLLGKPNCGQEAVARLLLELSPQNHRMFVVLPAAEAESRLVRHAGLTSLPGDIFLFLPDVERFSLQAQGELLHLLRLRRSRPFTVVAASADDLRTLVGLGQFLPELAEILSGVRLTIPDLEQRKEDLPMLIGQILAGQCKESGHPVPQVTEGFLRAAMQHNWPGNLDELRKVLECVCGETGEALLAEHLVGALAHLSAGPAPGSVPPRLVPLDTVMKEHISAVLRSCRGNKLRAAEILGISRSTLYRMLDTPAADASAAAVMPQQAPTQC